MCCVGGSEGESTKAAAVSNPYFRLSPGLRWAATIEIELIIATRNSMQSRASQRVWIGTANLKYYGMLPRVEADDGLKAFGRVLIARLFRLSWRVIKDGSIPCHLRPKDRHVRYAADEHPEITVRDVNHWRDVQNVAVWSV